MMIIFRVLAKSSDQVDEVWKQKSFDECVLNNDPECQVDTEE